MATFKIKKEDGSWGIVSGSSLKVDATLTQLGQAADAKAVGDALKNVSIDTSALIQKSGDTMEGALVADEISVSDLGVSQMRNIWAGTAPVNDVVSQLKKGDIYMVYSTDT